MGKNQARALLSKLLPHIRTSKQRLALFSVVLILALARIDFDSAHTHVDPAPVEPTTNVFLYVSGNTAPKAVVSSSLVPFEWR